MIKEMLKVFGYIKLSEYKEASKIANERLNKKCKDYQSRFTDYPHSRDSLKNHLGSKKEFDGVICSHDERKGYLIKSVKFGKNKICNHIWVKPSNNISHIQNGEQVTMYGKVYKYLKKSNIYGMESFSIESPIIKIKEWK